MKVKKIETIVPETFKPVTIQLTFESQKEVNLFNHLCVCFEIGSNRCNQGLNTADFAKDLIQQVKAQGVECDT